MPPTLTAEKPTGQQTRRYPPEFRAEAVSLVREAIADAGGDPSGVVPSIAEHVGVSPATLRAWVRRAEHGAHKSTLRQRARHRTAWTRGPNRRRARRSPVLTDLELRPRSRPAGLPPPPPPAQVTEPAPVAGRWRTAARDLRQPLAWYLAARVTVLVAMVIAAQPRRGQLVAARAHMPWPSVTSSSRLLEAFSSWDAGWYVHVATHGYVPLPIPRGIFTRDIAFLPAFPFLVRAVSAVTFMSPLAAGVVVTLLLGAGATAGVWYATRAIAGREIANRTVALWALFPGAYVFSLVYAEGLTLLCATACLVALLRRRWVVAGVAAAIAMASQPDAAVLAVCCAWCALVAIRTRRDWSALAAPLLAPVGLVWYLLWLWGRSGDPLVWVHSQRVLWAHGKLGPYWTVIAPLREIFHHGSADNAVRVGGLLLVAGGFALLWRWRPPAIFTMWAAGTLFLALLSAPVGTRPRFVFVAFPLFIAAARKLSTRWIYGIAVAEAALLGLVTFSTITTVRLVP